MTKTKLKRQVEKLNELLASELGRNPYGTGNYKWAFSEDLWHPMAVIEESDDGRVRPVLDYVADERSGLLVAQQKFVLRHECPSLDHQWVLCKWQAPVDPAEWRRIFGHSLEWPGTQDYAPISASGSGNYASLDPGEHPTERTTWQAIQTVKQNLSVDHRQMDYESQRAQERAEQSQRAELVASIADAGTIAGRPWLRGRGNQDYSFGGVGPAQKEN